MFFGISNFLEEISSLSHSIFFLSFFALITEEGFLISPCYSLELCIQLGTSFLLSFAFHFSSLFVRPPQTAILLFCISFSWGEGSGKPLQYSCLENPMNSMKRQKERTPKDELTSWVGAQYATGDQGRNNSRKNEGMEPKQKQHPVVDGTGDRSKV